MYTCYECDVTGCGQHGGQCEDCSNWVCSRHVASCVDCGAMRCIAHKIVGLRGEALCSVHGAQCIDCGTGPCDPYYRIGTVGNCGVCGTTVCHKHSKGCAVCGMSLCSKHATTVLGDNLVCPSHVGHCIQCKKHGPKAYALTSLENCAACNDLMCSDHKRKCSVCCETWYCASHEADLNQCIGCGSASCGTGSCSAYDHVCNLCRLPYCRNCVGSRGLCRACDGIQWVAADAKELGALLFNTTRESPGRDDLITLCDNTSKVVCAKGVTAKGNFLLLRYQPSKLAFWKQGFMLRVCGEQQAALAAEYGRITRL